MCCADASKDGSDNLEVGSVSGRFDQSATGWLLSQAVWYLNAADKEGEFAYMRVVEILRRYILICWTRCMGSSANSRMVTLRCAGICSIAG